MRKSIVLLYAILILGSLTRFPLLNAQREIYRNTVEGNEEFFVMGNDSGYLTLYDAEGTLILQRLAASQEVGHLEVGIKTQVWINGTTIAFQSVPYHYGLWNTITDYVHFFEPDNNGLRSLTLDAKSNSLAYVSGNETIKWRSLSNYSIILKDEPKDYLFNMGILDPYYGRVNNLKFDKDMIFFQYNSDLFSYNRTSRTGIGRFDELTSSVIVELDTINEKLYLAKNGQVSSFDYNLIEKYSWYFGEKTISSLESWEDDIIVGFTNGEIRMMQTGNAHGHIIETGMNSIEDLTKVDNKIVFVSSMPYPIIKNISDFEKEWVSPKFWVNELFWRNGIDPTIGWIIIIVFILILSFFLIPKIFNKLQGPISKVNLAYRKRIAKFRGFDDYDEKTKIKEKGFVSKEEYQRIHALGYPTKTAYNQATSAAQKEGWKTIEDKKIAQQLGISDPSRFYHETNNG